MDRKQNLFQGAMAGIGMIILILDSSAALEGAQSGIDLCIQTVIPSLFPFFVMSMILTNSLHDCLSHPLQLIARFLGIPRTSASILFPAVLGGYPVGAKCVSDLYQKEQITRNEAERLLAFCSNAGPSFLFGMVSVFFPEKKSAWLLWLIHIFSALLTAAAIPARKELAREPGRHITQSKQSIILSAAKAMVLVCCWVVLFRIVISFLNNWFLWLLPAWLQVIVMGILELTNGCCELPLIADVKLRFVLCACLLSFGGMSVLFQTAAVTKGLSLGWYLKGKLMQTLFSFLLSCAIVSDEKIYYAVFIPILVIILRKTEKRYSNQRILPV